MSSCIARFALSRRLETYASLRWTLNRWDGKPRIQSSADYFGVQLGVGVRDVALDTI